MLSILLIVPMLVGMAFLSPNSALNAPQTAQNGGGGANSLDSPKIGKKDTNSNQVGEEEYVVTYKTYDDYFTDLNITKETITEAELSGNGSATNPYIVRSTRGFLWLTNYSLSGISLGNQHIELACDIILNDETFDEKGVPSGGDGVVYQMLEYAEYMYNLTVDCNGFSIRGIYYNDVSTNSFCLFGLSFKKVENLVVENFFINANSGDVSLLGKWGITVNNVIAKQGCLLGKNAFWVYGPKEIYDCENYATITGTSTASPYGYNLVNGNIRNCKNFGDIYVDNQGASGWASGGIVCMTEVKSEIRNCENYGDIYATGRHIGGIVGIFYNNPKGVLLLEDCKNYGNIYDLYDCCAGGIVGTAEGTIYIDNCKNFASIFTSDWKDAGQIIGVAYPYNYDTDIVIENCYSFSTTNVAVIGRQVNRTSLKLTIDKCVFDFDVENSDLRDIIMDTEAYTRPTEIYLKNIEINIMQKSSSSFQLIRALREDAYLHVENVFLKSNVKTTNINYVHAQNTLIDFCNFVVNAGAEKIYYGNNFSGYCMNYKTGELGLKALSAKGFYQGKVTEELLLAKGYEKKAI